MPLSDSDKIRAVEDHYRSFWTGDLDDFDHQLSPDFTDTAAPPGTPPGPEGIKQWAAMARQASNDMACTIDEAIVAGPVVAVKGVWKGTHTGEIFGVEATGRAVEFEGIVVWELDDEGRITGRTAFFDLGAVVVEQITASD